MKISHLASTAGRQLHLIINQDVCQVQLTIAGPNTLPDTHYVYAQIVASDGGRPPKPQMPNGGQRPTADWLGKEGPPADWWVWRKLNNGEAAYMEWWGMDWWAKEGIPQDLWKTEGVPMDWWKDGEWLANE